VTGPVILIEPVCLGFEHAQFNTPLVRSVSCAFPGVPIVYAGEETHLEHVRAMLCRVSPDTVVEWRPIRLPRRDASPRNRMQSEYGLLQEILKEASRSKATAVIATSATDTAVLAAKILLYRHKAPCPFLVILHSVLAGLEDRSRRFSRWRGISFATRIPHPRQMKFIVPGRPIQRYLETNFPALAGHCRPLDHPAFWMEHAATIPAPTSPVRFGFFGVSAVPGFDLVVQIARELKEEGCPAEFSMIGHLNHPDDAVKDFSAVPDASTRILSPAEYAERARRVTYALWTTRTHRSGLVASSTFLDALSFVKPIVYLSNPLIDGYARELGDIGHACDDATVLKNTIRQLAANPPGERYIAQCKAILSGRRAFEPDVVGAALRTIIEEIRTTR
jgi:hypothetical protein